MSNTKHFDLLNEKAWHDGQQSVCFKADYRLANGHTVRVFIRRDAYDFQSYLSTEFLTAVGWKRLDRAAMTDDWASHLIGYQNANPERTVMPELRRDALRLLARAADLLQLTPAPSAS